MLTGFIRDAKSWAELLAWVRSQKFADHEQTPESVPFRIENILKNYAKMITWDGTQMQWTKGFIAGHYATRQASKLTREEQLARGQIEMAI